MWADLSGGRPASYNNYAKLNISDVAAKDVALELEASVYDK